MFTSGFSVFPCQGSQATSPIKDTWATAPASGPSRSWYDDPWRLMPIGQLVNEYKKLSVVRKAHGLDPSLLDSLIAPSHHSPPRWWLGLASVWQTSNPGLATSCAVPWSYKPENCWGLWPGPFHSPIPCSQPRSNFFFLSVACVLFFFLPVLYILVASNSILISTFLANATLQNISLGAESFWPNSLTTPIPRKHILYYEIIFCQKH